MRIWIWPSVLIIVAGLVILLIAAAWIEAAIWRMPYCPHPEDLSEQLFSSR